MKSAICVFCIVFLFFIPSFCLAEHFPKNNNLKVTVLSLFSGSTKLTYERLVANKQSIELTGGIIGAGFDILNHNKSKGALCRLTYKFILAKNQKSSLEGYYVKPELAYSSYTYENEGMRLPVKRLAIMACTGYQIVKSWFVFDIFAGLGVGVGDANNSNYHHGFIGFNSVSPFAFTAGFKLGAAF